MRVFDLLIIYLLAVSNLPLTAQSIPIIRSITFAGNNTLTSSELYKTINSKPRTEYDYNLLQMDINLILQKYIDKGFYFAEIKYDSVNSTDKTGLDLIIKIHEGVQCRFGNILLLGNKQISTEKLIAGLNIQGGEVFNPASLESGIEKILQLYDESGYPYAWVNLKYIQPGNGIDSVRLSVGIEIDEGDYVTIDQIRLVGNSFTSDDVIVREMRLNPNEPFRLSKIQNVKTRLQRLNIFEKVDEPKLFSEGSRHGILVKVKEGNTNTFDGIIGYSPKSGNRSGTITGLISVSMRNLFGTGRKLRLRWQRESELTQEIEVNYTEPWLFNIPLSVSAGYYQRKEDTLFVRRYINLISDYDITDAVAVGLSVKQEYVIPSENSINISKIHALILGMNLNYDTRDDRISPTEGVFYRTSYEYGKNVYGNESKSIQRIGIDFEIYLKLFVNQIIAVGVHGKSVSGGMIGNSDLYRFGGTNTLRGYRENEFLGSRIAWSNLEYRYLVAQRSYLYGFTDGGYYYSPATVQDNFAAEKWKIGYGIGMRFQTTLGLLGVSFAFGEGDSFLQGKIHIGLINEF